MKDWLLRLVSSSEHVHRPQHRVFDIDRSDPGTLYHALKFHFEFLIAVHAGASSKGFHTKTF